MRLSNKSLIAGFAVVAAATGVGTAFALSTQTCPKGQEGVVIQNGDQTTSVCTNAHKDILDDVVVTIHKPTLPPLPTGWAQR